MKIRMIMMMKDIISRLEKSRRKEHEKVQSILKRVNKIKDSLKEIEELTGQKTKWLYQNYMHSVFPKIEDDAWWEENGEYIHEPWFILSFLTECGFISEIEDKKEIEKSYIIKGSDLGKRGVFVFQVKRKLKYPELGEIMLSFDAPDTETDEIMKGLFYKKTNFGYLRKIGEMASPINDRVCECAVNLLQNGYAVVVFEKQLYSKITKGEYQEECIRWIHSVKDPHLLALKYPKSDGITGFIQRCGARWNGKNMVIGIQHTERLIEIENIFGFKVTENARLRMNAWQEAVNRTTVYRERKNKANKNAVPVRELFQAILQRDIEVPSDLRDYYD